jgi:hypothetical protein
MWVAPAADRVARHTGNTSSIFDGLASSSPGALRRAQRAAQAASPALAAAAHTGRHVNFRKERQDQIALTTSALVYVLVGVQAIQCDLGRLRLAQQRHPG